jgi:hypothetical protein
MLDSVAALIRNQRFRRFDLDAYATVPELTTARLPHGGESTDAAHLLCISASLVERNEFSFSYATTSESRYLIVRPMRTNFM